MAEKVFVHAISINIDILTSNQQSLKLLTELNESCKDLIFEKGHLRSISVGGFVEKSHNDKVATIGSYELYLYSGERKDPEDVRLSNAVWGRVTLELPPESIFLNT